MQQSLDIVGGFVRIRQTPAGAHGWKPLNGRRRTTSPAATAKRQQNPRRVSNRELLQLVHQS